MLDNLRSRVQSDPDPEPDPGPTTDLGLDDVHDILKNERRRRILDHLSERSWMLDDLAVSMASIENDKPERLIDSQEKKRVYVACYQCHLPQLDGLGVIAWDKRSGQITRGPEYGGVRRLQTAVREIVEADS